MTGRIWRMCAGPVPQTEPRRPPDLILNRDAANALNGTMKIHFIVA